MPSCCSVAHPPVPLCYTGINPIRHRTPGGTLVILVGPHRDAPGPDASTRPPNIATLVACATLFPAAAGPQRASSPRWAACRAISPRSWPCCYPWSGFTISRSFSRPLGTVPAPGWPSRSALYGVAAGIGFSRDRCRAWPNCAGLLRHALVVCRRYGNRADSRPRSISAPWDSPAACCWPGSRSEARYGDVDLSSTRRHGHPMPSRFSTLLALLGAQPSACRRSAYFPALSMLLTCRPLRRPPPSRIIMLVWLTASWYQIDWFQQLVLVEHAWTSVTKTSARPSSCRLCCCSSCC